jgi:phosphoglycolate phosphatase-like HAD superfamily hydrolase
MTTPSTAARVFVQDNFAWDAQSAYLFDIDGTLLRSRDRIHYDSFFAAAEAVLGHTLVLDGVVLHGNTDPGILREALRKAQLEDSVYHGSLEAISAHMSQTVLARRQELDLRVMPGVAAMLGYLRHSGAALGVATGNLETIGWLKVEVAGLREWFSFGGFADGFDVRSDMIANALRLAHKAAGRGASVCVVGDTPFDIRAARVNGLPTIAVATGHYSFDELMESRPEVCCTTLEALLAHAGQIQTSAAATAEVG